MKITITTSRILQGVLTVAHILNLALAVVPAHDKVWVALAIGACNIVVNDWSHNSTPDGQAIPQKGA